MNARVSRAPTPSPASMSILRLLDLSSAPSLRVLNRCLNSRSRPPLTPEATSAPPPTNNGSSTPTQAQQNYAHGRMNYVALEEAHNAATMVPSTSLVNSIPS
jgi:hypothetical protein